MAVATAHLIHGFIGAGKTTFARQLEQSLGAQRFTHDEWMVQRHGHAPDADRFPEFLEQIDRDIWDAALQVLDSGQDVIIDVGFWSRASRREAIEKVTAAGAVVRFYSVVSPIALMRERTLRRSEAPPGDSLWIDGPAFDTLLLQFEPMSPDEEFIEIDGQGSGALLP